MNIKKTGLGRGLSDLGLTELLSSSQLNKQNSHLRNISIELLVPNRYQPRQDIASANLEELAESIKAQGIIQPILARKHLDNNYEIIAGERRWRASHLAGLTEVPVIVKEFNDEQAMAIALIENLQREDLNAIDIAQGLQRLNDEFHMTHQAIAVAVGKSRATVTNLLRLLNLPDVIKTMVQEQKLEMGHARALLTLPIKQQLELAEIIVNKNLSVRACEELIKKMLCTTSTIDSNHLCKYKNIIVDPNVMQLQNKIADTLGAKVQLNYTNKGKKQSGKIVVYYNSLDELDGLLSKIGVSNAFNDKENDDSVI